MWHEGHNLPSYTAHLTHTHARTGMHFSPAKPGRLSGRPEDGLLKLGKITQLMAAWLPVLPRLMITIMMPMTIPIIKTMLGCHRTTQSLQ